jgi:hypothetical protein
MKKPKIKDTMYVVLRKYGILNNTHCIDVCMSIERANELVDNYTFDYQERGLVGFKFEVQPVSFHPE